MQAHINEISRHVAEATLPADHGPRGLAHEAKAPMNFKPIVVPPRSREPNPVENVWQNLRNNWLSNPVFGDYGVWSSRLVETPGATPPLDHIHRNAGLGTCRLGDMTVGII